MIQVFSKKYENRFSSEVTYYVSIQNYGIKPYFQVIYENVTDYTYYVTKYVVFLGFYPKNRDKIEVEVLKYSPDVLNKIKSKRKLAVLSKFFFYVILRNNDVNVTKSIKKVIYYNNGQESILSANAFLKSYYRLVPVFDKIIQESKSG